jgi:hypothetical protein
MTPGIWYTINKLIYSKQLRIMVGVFYCIVYEVVYIIRVSTLTFRILYIGSLHEVVYIIPVTAYMSIRLYEYLPHPFLKIKYFQNSKDSNSAIAFFSYLGSTLPPGDRIWQLIYTHYRPPSQLLMAFLIIQLWRHGARQQDRLDQSLENSFIKWVTNMLIPIYATLLKARPFVRLRPFKPNLIWANKVTVIFSMHFNSIHANLWCCTIS